MGPSCCTLIHTALPARHIDPCWDLYLICMTFKIFFITLFCSLRDCLLQCSLFQPLSFWYSLPCRSHIFLPVSISLHSSCVYIRCVLPVHVLHTIFCFTQYCKYIRLYCTQSRRCYACVYVCTCVCACVSLCLHWNQWVRKLYKRSSFEAITNYESVN